MIRYLIKFVSKFEHAEMLQNGLFFMRPMSYYHYLEQGQGDQCEGAVSHSIAMYKNTQWGIYCFYSVDDSEISDDGSICFSKRCIDDFKCQNGYAVVIDYEKFEEILYQIDTQGYQLTAGKVSYRYITFEELADILKKESLENVFIKRPVFSYQKEYRFVTTQNIPNDEDSMIYKAKTDLKKISTIVDISTIKQENENYVLSKEQINLK